MWDDYQHIYNDFGVNSDTKIKSRVLFLHALANQDLVSESQAKTLQDPNGYYLFDFSCQPPKPLM